MRVVWCVFLLAVAAASCGDDDSQAVDPVGPTTTVVTTTTVDAATTTTATMTTTTSVAPAPDTSTTSTTPLPDPAAVVPSGITLLVAHHDGIELWSAQGATPILEGIDVVAAYADGRGGVIYQERATQEQIARFQSPPIMRLLEPGATPAVLVPASTAVRLIDVSRGPGQPLVAYSVFVPDPDRCGGASPGAGCAEASSEDLVVLDLGDDFERRFTTWTEWEYTAFHFDLGDELMATQAFDLEGSIPPCLGVFTVEEVMASSGGQQVCPHEPEPCPSFIDGGTCRWQLWPIAISPDDATLAYLWWRGDGDGFELVRRNAATLEQLSRAPVAIPAGFFPGFGSSMDLAADGWLVIRGETGSVVVTPDGTATQPVAIPWATIWAG